MKLHLPLLLAGLVALSSGCVSYRYRVVEPSTGAPPVASQPVFIHYDPLDYRLSKDHDRLAMQISNPTSDRIVLLGHRSYAVDPRGESHPLRDRVIGPHSFTVMLVPPIPFTYAYPDYWAWGGYWGPGWYDPFWGGWYGPWYGPPPVSYATVRTGYDWKWTTGVARLRLTYERNGKYFEHNFEFVREEDKKH